MIAETAERVELGQGPAIPIMEDEVYPCPAHQMIRGVLRLQLPVNRILGNNERAAESHRGVDDGCTESATPRCIQLFLDLVCAVGLNTHHRDIA